MEENNALTYFKKYGVVIFFSLLFLVGCGTEVTPIDSNPTGVFDRYLVYPFSLLIKKLAALFGSYGLSIIVITLGIRLVLLPFMINQTKNSQLSQVKMKKMKPEMDNIQEKYKGKKDTASQLEMQKELSALYEEHNFNPIKTMTGCLPMIIQLPFLIAFYYAIRRTPEIAIQPFLWFNLGQTDYFLVILAVVIYYFQSRVSLIGLGEAQRKQMAMIGYISPIMIGIVSLNVPAALPLYWAVGGLFMILQTLIIKKFVA